MILVRHLLFVAAILVAAAILHAGVSTLAALGLVVAGFVALAVYHGAYLSRLHHWAGLPRQRELPVGFASWGIAFDRLGRSLRQEATERAETAAELERMSAAVDLVPDGLVVLDRFDHVAWSNRAARELHGIFGTGRPIDHFVRQPEFIQYLRTGDFGGAVQISLPSAPNRRFALRLYPTDHAFRLLVTRDVTESTRLDQMRRDFVANVSHEIRTPLTVVAGFVETLLEMDLPADERRRCLEMVQRQTGTMQRLVEDLLTLATLENATAPPESVPIEVGPMLQALLADMRALSGDRHRFELRLETDAGLSGAPVELDSAIRNLLTNAVRYTPDGGLVTVTWRLSGRDGLLSVRDTGIGIAAEHLPRLTERFYRVDRGRSRESGGTGLGLAIVKHVLQRHQARLEVESRVGAGSVFGLRFPASRVVSADRLAAGPYEAKPEPDSPDAAAAVAAVAPIDGSASAAGNQSGPQRAA